MKHLKIAAFAASSAIFFQACSGKNAPAPPPPPQVTVEAAEPIDERFYESYPATVTPLEQVELRPQVNGFITGIYFQDGARVRKGQLLYTIDEQLYSANYKQAEAAYQVQQANLSRAQKDADRYHKLDEQEAIAKQVVDNADAALEVAKRQADAARANVSAMQTNVRYTKVTAPFDGVIGISNVKVGAAITAGQTVLNTISSEGDLAVDVNVAQAEILRFTKMMNEPQTPADSMFRLAFGSEVYPYPGKLTALDRAVNPQTGTIRARFTFPNTGNLLRAGMTGTLNVQYKPQAGAVRIPYKAIVEQLGEFFVYIPADSNKVTQRRVELGPVSGTNVVITAGLQQGERIVVEGVQNLKEGSQVKVVPAKAQQ